MIATVFPHEDDVAQYLTEWARWRRGEGVSMRSVSIVFDELDAIKRDARKDESRPPPTITAYAERTHRALAELARQAEQQRDCLVLYHLHTSCAASISRKLRCSRNRVTEQLRLAHDNFISIRGALA